MFPCRKCSSNQAKHMDKDKKTREGERKHKGIVPNKPFQLSFCMHYGDETLKVCTAKESAEAAMAASLITKAPPPTIPPSSKLPIVCGLPPSVSLRSAFWAGMHPLGLRCVPLSTLNLALTCFIPSAPAAHWASDSQAAFVVDGSV